MPSGWQKISGAHKGDHRTFLRQQNHIREYRHRFVLMINIRQPQDILRDADTAMYRAKAMGGGCYQVFDTAMHTKAVALLQLEADMKRAVTNQEWQVYYQPILSMASGEINGVEALVRWNHPQRGLLLPQDFIHEAEDVGLILPIGEFVLRYGLPASQSLAGCRVLQIVDFGEFIRTTVPGPEPGPESQPDPGRDRAAKRRLTPGSNRNGCHAGSQLQRRSSE